MNPWIGYLQNVNLPSPQRAACGLVADLSCSPWKFDALWDVWAKLGVRTSNYKSLASHVLASSDPEIMLYGAAAFDDITLFCDTVGDGGNLSSVPREACRAVYLSLRPLLSRRVATAAPNPPFGNTREEVILRLTFVAAQLSEMGDLAPLDVAFAQAASRFRARGKVDGATMCEQNARVIQVIRDGILAAGGARNLASEAFNMLVSVDGSVLANEIIAQWWPIYSEGVADAVRARDADDADALEGVRELREMIRMVGPLGWLAGARPGVGSATVGLTLIRLAGGADVPGCLSLYPPEWIESCQESVVALKKEWSGEPRVPPDILNSLLDRFVELGHNTRR
jgi:hypothetical protein